MRISDLTNSLKAVYRKTTLLGGTIHLLKGSWKMTKVFFLSAYWKHNFLKCGKNPSIFPKTIIDFPKNISVGNNFSINLRSHIRSENSTALLKIGNDVGIGMDVVLDYSGGIEIGKKTVISDYAHVYTHSHGLNPWDFPKFKKLVIGKNVWIADGAMILPQVSKIGDGAIVGARSVVTKDVPPHVIVAGNPARIIKELKKE